MTIRVLIGEMSAMIGSALRGTLAGCDDIELVRQDSADPDYEEVDVLVVHDTQVRDCPAMLTALVRASPIGVVSIGAQGMAGNLYRFERESWRFVDGADHGLVDAIRAAAGTA